MPDHFNLLIPGATANGKIDVTAPFDGAHIATIDTGGNDAVEIALKTADALYRDKPNWLTAEHRIKILNKTAGIMQDQFDALAIEAAREGDPRFNSPLVGVFPP